MNSPSTGDEVISLLEKVREGSALTWLEIATRLGISETYLHRVRKGQQKFSRKVVASLRTLADGSPAAPAQAASQDREEAAGALAELRRENAELRRMLAQAQDTIGSQARTIEALAAGRTPSGSPPAAAPASGANGGSHRPRLEGRVA